jgi:hypothetical protein
VALPHLRQTKVRRRNISGAVRRAQGEVLDYTFEQDDPPPEGRIEAVDQAFSQPHGRAGKGNRLEVPFYREELQVAVTFRRPHKRRSRQAGPEPSESYFLHSNLRAADIVWIFQAFVYQPTITGP